MRDVMVQSAFDLSVRRMTDLGAEPDDEGTNFAIFSEHAEAVELCLFSEDGKTELSRLMLPHSEGGIFHGYLPDIEAGQVYGYRVHGRWAPEEGHRFNPHKLLLDPYAKEISGNIHWNDSLHAYRIGEDDLSFDTRDSAPYMPKGVVRNPAFDWESDRALNIDWGDTLIYEAHVKGMTMLHPEVDERLRGTFEGMASGAVIEHLLKLGVTAVELLPVHSFVTDRMLEDRGLTNYWGYQTLNFFAPHPAYLQSGRIREFKKMVRRFHAAGIEVILDVVYNHTGEGNEMGPSLSFRGIDNASYYVLAPDSPRHSFCQTGTGNTLNIKHPMVLRMVLDSLRYWVQSMHVDGFRFDLASTLGREQDGFDREGGFFDAIRQDPVLSKVKLIAEPWDVGEGGYQVGGFPWPFREWNDKARDDMRAFWRRDPGQVANMSQRLTGSPLQFNHSQRPATSSVNFLAAHDGFTLADVVSYNEKHNDANGEGGQDGHDHNLSDNMGAEGPTEDQGILDARRRRMAAMLGGLMFSQGVPMILSGDEIAHSQDGNNNVYCQDNALSWIDWTKGDDAMLEAVRRLIAARKAAGVFGSGQFLPALADATDGQGIRWLHPENREMAEGDWQDAGLQAMALLIAAQDREGVLRECLLAVNAGEECSFEVGHALEGAKLVLLADSAEAAGLPGGRDEAEALVISGQSVRLWAVNRPA